MDGHKWDLKFVGQGGGMGGRGGVYIAAVCLEFLLSPDGVFSSRRRRLEDESVVDQESKKTKAEVFLLTRTLGLSPALVFGRFR